MLISAFQAYDEIRLDIVELRLTPGSLLDIDALCSHVGSTRAEVRAALGRLRREGLVTLVDGVDHVSPVDVKSADDLLVLRELLEGGAIEAAAKAGVDRHQADALRRLCDGRALSDNTAFHVAMAGLAGNGLLVAELERTLTQLERLFNLGVPQGTFTKGTPGHHAELLDAVLAGDAPRARALAVAHAGVTRSLVLDTLAWRVSLVAHNGADAPAAG